jgi:hypothetical protein
MLQIARTCACKDPRDKFYAIRGLIPDQISTQIQTDYSEDFTAATLYLQLAAMHLLQTQDLSLLAYIQPPRQALAQHSKNRLVDASALSAKDQKQRRALPSWVPDWYEPTFETLSAQCFAPSPKRLGFPPRLVARGYGAKLSFLDHVDVPMDAGLRVRGRRIGTVWPDSSIFGRPNLPPSVKLKTETKLERMDEAREIDSTMEAILAWRVNWITNPSIHAGTRLCLQRQNFWSHFTNYIQNTNGLRYFRGSADIPPAFGGFCAGCLRVDLINWAMFTQPDSVYSMADVRRCLCQTHIRSEARDDAEGHKSYHYFESRLDEFCDMFNKHGSKRRLFGTESSLGFGPSNLEYGDSVWLLDGARGPVILRPAGPSGHRLPGYAVIGECYVYDATSVADTCAVCNSSTPRRTIDYDIRRDQEDAAKSFEQQLFEEDARDVNHTGLRPKTSTDLEEIELW